MNCCSSKFYYHVHKYVLHNYHRKITHNINHTNKHANVFEAISGHNLFTHLNMAVANVEILLSAVIENTVSDFMK